MGLFRWFSNKPPVGEAFAWPGGGLDEAIAAVAALRSEPAIQVAARQFPQHFGPEVIPELTRRFDTLIEPPPSFSAREPSLTAWVTCWQTALVEIIYQYREHALPALRELARDGQDGRAIVLLGRLAADGVDRERVIADLRSLMPDLLASVRCDVADRLLGLARKDAALAALVRELRQVPSFEEALAEAERFDQP